MSKREDDGFPHELLTAVDEIVGVMSDAVLLGSRPLQRLSKRILKLQRRLRRRVNDDGWEVFLRLEEAMNERADAHASILVRWAFSAAARKRPL